MLAWCDRPWNEPIAKMAPRYGEATPLRLAANAVMAGCRPEYFPLIMLAIEAMCEEPFNLYGVQATTHLCAPLVIVNGPVAQELALMRATTHSVPARTAMPRSGAPYASRCSTSAARCPALGDMSTFGAPSKYSYWWPKTRLQALGSRCMLSAGFRRRQARSRWSAPNARTTLTTMRASPPKAS